MKDKVTAASSKTKPSKTSFTENPDKCKPTNQSRFAHENERERRDGPGGN